MSSCFGACAWRAKTKRAGEADGRAEQAAGRKDEAGEGRGQGHVEGSIIR
jgi:hypothetical protein